MGALAGSKISCVYVASVTERGGPTRPGSIMGG